MKDQAHLTYEFFVRDTATVARELIGTHLIHITDGERHISMVTETEAYVGPHDLACHAAKGRTKRTETLYGPPGTLYVYLCYGVHWMLNVVTEREGYPAGILFRGIEAVSGPGRLTRALGINQSLNAKPATPETGLWFAPRSPSAPKQRIKTTPRIGVDYAGPIWAKKKLRFVLGDSETKRA